MKVHVASVLYAYTSNRAEVQAEGATLRDALEDLDRRHPGLLFRIVDEQGRLRQHINLFVSGRATRDLSTPLGSDDEIHVLQALSGG